MNALAVPPSMPAAPPASSASTAAQDGPADSGRFAVVLDGTASAGTGPKESTSRQVKPGAAKRSGMSGDEVGGEDSDGTDVADDPGAGAGGGKGASAAGAGLLDIAMLAQIAAGSTPPVPPPSAAATSPEAAAAASRPALGAGSAVLGQAVVDPPTAGATAQAAATASGSSLSAVPADGAPPQAQQSSVQTSSASAVPARGAAQAASMLAQAASAADPTAQDATALATPGTAAGAAEAALAARATMPMPTAASGAASARPQPSTMDQGSITARPGLDGLVGQIRHGSGGQPSSGDQDGDGSSSLLTSDGTKGVASSGMQAVITDTTPLPMPTPAQQVVSGLQSLIAATAASPASASREVASLPASISEAGGVKTVTIQLDPVHLGPVSVTVRMRGDQVDIQIAVSNPQALHLLERDRHALSAAVESMGGSGAALHLAAASESSEGGGSSSGGFSSSPDGFGRQNASSDAASTGRDGQNRSAASSNAPQSDTDDTVPAPIAAQTNARDGSLYL